MLVYVAGASRELGRVRRVMDLLRGAGHTIAEDWTVEVDRLGTVPADADQRRSAATRDLRALLEADAFVLLVPEAETKGTWFEHGFWTGAHAGERPALVSHATLEAWNRSLASYIFVDSFDVECFDAEIPRILRDFGH
jgi:hypothetical protein